MRSDFLDKDGSDAERSEPAGKRLLKGSATYGIGNLMQKGIGFLLIPIYTSYLTPDDYGIVAVAAAVGSAFTIFFGLGLHGAVTRQYYDHSDDPEEVREYLSTVVLFLLGFGLGAVVLILIFGRPTSDALLENIPFHPFITLTVWTSFLLTLTPILLSLYRAREQVVRYIALSLIQVVLSAVGVIYFVVVLNRGALGKIEGSFWGAAGLFGISTILVIREANFRFSTRKLRRALDFSLPLVPHLLFAWVFSVSDRILLERMTTLAEVGIYNLGYQLGLVVSLVVGAINKAWTPIFYDTAKSDPDAHSIISRITSFYVGGIVICTSILILFSKEVVTIVAPSTYLSAHRVIPLIATAYVFQGIYFMSATQIFYSGRTRAVPVLTLIAGATNIGINLLLIPLWGIIGAAVASLASFAVLAAATHWVGQRAYYVKYQYAVPVVSLIGLALVVATTYWLNGFPMIVSLFIKIPVALVMLGGGLAISRYYRRYQIVAHNTI